VQDKGESVRYGWGWRNKTRSWFHGFLSFASNKHNTLWRCHCYVYMLLYL